MRGNEQIGLPEHPKKFPYRAVDVSDEGTLEARSADMVSSIGDDDADSIIDFEGMVDLSDGSASAEAKPRELSADEREQKKRELVVLDERHTAALNRHIALAEKQDGPERRREEAAIDQEIVFLQAEKQRIQNELGMEPPRGVIGGGSESDEGVTDDGDEDPIERKSVFSSMLRYLGDLDRRLDRKLRRTFRSAQTILHHWNPAEEDASVVDAPADTFKLGGVPRKDPDAVIDPNRIRGGENLSLTPEERKVTGWGALDGKDPEMWYTGDGGNGNQYQRSMSMESPGGWGVIDGSDAGKKSDKPADPWAGVELTPEQRARNHPSIDTRREKNSNIPLSDKQQIDVPVAMNAKGEVMYDVVEKPLSDAERLVVEERKPVSQAPGYADYLATLEREKGVEAEDRGWVAKVRALIPKLGDPDPSVAREAKAEIEAIRAAEKERHDGATLY